MVRIIDISEAGEIVRNHEDQFTREGIDVRDCTGRDWIVRDCIVWDCTGRDCRTSYDGMRYIF